MSKWKEFTIQDFGEILDQRRKPLSSMERATRKGSYPYYGASGVIDFIDDFIFEGEHVLISEDGENLKSRQTPVAFLANGKFWVNNHAHVFKGNSASINRLVTYYIQNLDLNQYLTGAVQPKLNKSILLSIPFFLPEDVREQKAIAEVLTSLDDKIDLLSQQNKTLEQLAETLFRHHFIDNAKDDWEEKPLDTVVDISIGRTPPRQENQWFSRDSSDIKWISIKDMGGDGVYISSTSECLTKAAVEKFKIPTIPENTVLLSFKMTVGRVVITTEEMLSNEAIAQFRFNHNTPFTQEYLYLFLRSFKWDLLGSTSSIVTSINSAMIKEMEIVIPDEDSMSKFEEITKPQFKKIRENQEQIQSLEKLRDQLLPKLMSGEIRIN
jgi:type I restriction enzyme S subunit